MRISAAISAGCAALLFLAAGCVPVDQNVKPDSQAGAATPIQAVSTSAGLSSNEVADRRNIERELDRDHTAYLKRISERNVEAALEYVPAESRPAKQTELWQFIAEYSFDNFEVVSKNVDYSAKPIEAEVKAMLVVYQKNVVAPMKKEYATKWRRQGDKWLLKP